MKRNNPPARSYLYVPGDRRDRLDGAAARGADALILDLEDAVPPAAKDDARATVGRWLAQIADCPCQLWVRINADTPSTDISAVLTGAVEGLVVPKADPRLLGEVDHFLTAREHIVEIPPGATRLLPLIETARGLLASSELAAAPRVHRLGIGEADLAAELGVSGDRAELRSLRLQVVVASAAAAINAPVGPTSTDVRDLTGLRPSTEALLRLGFRGRTAIHPAQLPVINEVFTPAPEEVAKARRLILDFEQTERAGAGVLTDQQGRMVDVAVVRSAREIVARAEQAARSASA